MTASGSGHNGVDCSNHRIVASAVRTTGDVQAFVQCAAEYVMENGTQEARRAFNEDERWKHGPTYVFVDEIAMSGEESLTHVYPPDPSREGSVWGESIDSFGTDYYFELYRMMSIVDSGWIYYDFGNPATGNESPKSSYVIEIDWDGDRAAIGAGVYAPDLPGTCFAEEVNAASLDAHPSEEKLQEFVRCAAMMVESKGYLAKDELENNPRWNNGSTYAFVMDIMGNQVLTGSRVRVNRNALHEWGGRSAPTDQFGGRDMASVGDAFGEAIIYYQALNPMTGASQPKVGFVKRIVAQGVPLLVGAGYYISPDRAASASSCSDNYVTAIAIRTPEDLRAFVQCAADYVNEHGTEEARRAFHDDARWRHGPYYVFVDLIAQPHEDPLSHIAVFPPNPSWEGTSQVLIDNFGTDYFDELHRVMSFGDSGWIHYAFTNFVTQRSEPKSSYVVEVDWNGHRAVVGTGIYRRDLPGTCDSTEVNAAALEANPGTGRLQEFVRCAAFNVESMGFFAGPSLTRDPRWNSGSIFVSAINLDTGAVEFSDDPQVLLYSGRIPQLFFGGRDVLDVVGTFGEAFLYLNAPIGATGQFAPAISFSKRVSAQGVPLMVGSQIYPAASESE